MYVLYLLACGSFFLFRLIINYGFVYFVIFIFKIFKSIDFIGIVECLNFRYTDFTAIVEVN